MKLMIISGNVLMILGLAMAAVVVILSGRNGTFAAVKELKRIRTSGYIKEHKVFTGEDVYRNELSSGQSRLMSRRARRVLEKMDREDLTEEKSSRTPGSSHFEEVHMKEPGSERTALPGSGAYFDENTVGLLYEGEGKGASEDLCTENDSSYENSGATSFLGDAPDAFDSTIADGAGEITCVLGEKENETAILDPDENTGILPDAEATGILCLDDATCILDEGKGPLPETKHL